MANVQPADLIARGDQLRAQVAAHKAAIRRHRVALGAAKTELLAWEAECRAHGIRVTTVSLGEGAIHGQPRP